MKTELNIAALHKVIKQLYVSVILSTVMLTPMQLFAQADSLQDQKPVTEEEPTLISPSLTFVSVQKADNTVDLKASMFAKVNGWPKKLDLLKVSFLLISDTTEKALGYAITNLEGKAILNVKPEALATDKEGKLHIKAVFAGINGIESAEEEVIIKRARLEITAVPGDSLNNVQVKLVNVATGKEVPVPETTVGIFVRRLFRPLKIGEGTTDEFGEATVEIPGNLPGDAKGNITLIAKIDENEEYGNLEASVTQQWGIAVSDKIQKMPRALWSSQAPLWMMITFIILICTVWGHYLVIIIQLFRLRKEEPDPDSPTVEHLS